MLYQEHRWQSCRLLIVHGPPGVDAASVLDGNDVTLMRDDILMIAEHDEGPTPWLELNRITVPSEAGPLEDPGMPRAA